MSPSLGVPLTVNLQSQRACSPSEVKVKEIGPAARSCHGYTDRRMYDSYVQQQQHTRSSLAMSRAEQSRAASQISDAAACQVSHCHVLDPTCWIRSCLPRGTTHLCFQRLPGLVGKPVVPLVLSSLRKTPLFFEFSLCLSRACLGKMMHFIYKWPKKWRFPHPIESTDCSFSMPPHSTVSQRCFCAAPNRSANDHRACETTDVLPSIQPVLAIQDVFHVRVPTDQGSVRFVLVLPGDSCSKKPASPFAPPTSPEELSPPSCCCLLFGTENALRTLIRLRENRSF
jgi:hypothetical protein